MCYINVKHLIPTAPGENNLALGVYIVSAHKAHDVFLKNMPLGISVRTILPISLGLLFF